MKTTSIFFKDNQNKKKLVLEQELQHELSKTIKVKYINDISC